MHLINACGHCALLIQRSIITSLSTLVQLLIFRALFAPVLSRYRNNHPMLDILGTDI